MNVAYSVFADSLSQTPVFASPLDRGRFFNQGHPCKQGILSGFGYIIRQDLSYTHPERKRLWKS